MNPAFLESALFIALVAVAGAFFVNIVGWTPFGKRFKQIANRKRIDREAELTCPVHGTQRDEDFVRLPTGEKLCPLCYKEAVHGYVD